MWTFGSGAGEILQEVFKTYGGSSTKGLPADVSPLVYDTLFAVAGTPRMTATPGFLRNLPVTPQSARKVQSWLLESQEELLPRLVVFLRTSHEVGILGRVFLGFDGLCPQSSVAGLKSVENLLAITEERDTFFTFVLGWSGSKEDLNRFQTLTPMLATELMRNALSQPS